MYGHPAGTQVHAGQWQHDALHEAAAQRRYKVDSDFERDLATRAARAFQQRLVAAAAIALTAVTAVAVL